MPRTRGYNSSADVLHTTVDGQDLNTIWDEFKATLALQNNKQTALSSPFTFNTTLSSELVPQSLAGDDFEEASEFGVPTALRSTSELVKLGYPMLWYDKATRFTWRALSTMSAAQVSAIHGAALAADNRLVFTKIMQRVFNPATTLNEDGTSVFGFWNGVDGTPPDSPDGDVFDPTHSHYLTSGANVVDSGDLDALVDTVSHHGYGLRSTGDRVIVLANPFEADTIATFRVDSGAKFDAIRTSDAPAFITAETIEGNRPPGTFNGLTVACGYGDAWVVADRQVPIGYMVALATGGPNSERNPLGLRQHPQANLQGLLQIPGQANAYPLIDSYYTRAFGLGTRQRGAGAVMQVTTSSTYTRPAAFTGYQLRSGGGVPTSHAPAGPAPAPPNPRRGAPVHDDNPFTAGRDLVPAYEDNATIWDSAGAPDWADRARETAFSAPVPAELLATNRHTPLLSWADPDTPAVGLLDALLNPPSHRAAACDRCRSSLRAVPVHRLWVPCGQSCIEFQLCGQCRAALDAEPTSLVWR